MSLTLAFAALQVKADAAAASLEKLSSSATEAVAAVAKVRDLDMERFEKLLGKVNSSGGMQILGGDAPGGADLLNQLEQLIRDQRAAQHDPHSSAFTLTTIHDSIQKVVDLIHRWTGPEGMDFTIEKFKHYIDAKDRDAAAAGSASDGKTREAIGDATGAVSRDVRAQGNLVIGALTRMHVGIIQHFNKALDEAVRDIAGALPGKPRLRWGSNPPVSTGQQAKQADPTKVLITTGAL